MKNKIKFKHGGGFVGETYYMIIDDKVYNLVTNLGDVEEAKILARNKLKELGIKYDSDIIFEWDGCM